MLRVWLAPVGAIARRRDRVLQALASNPERRRQQPIAATCAAPLPVTPAPTPLCTQAAVTMIKPRLGILAFSTILALYASAAHAERQVVCDAGTENNCVVYECTARWITPTYMQVQCVIVDVMFPPYP